MKNEKISTPTSEIKMTEQDIKNEVKKRVRFKLESFFTVMENRIKLNTMSEFSAVVRGDYRTGQMAKYYADAWSQVREAFKKEIEMHTPSDRMFEDGKEKSKRAAIDMLLGEMEKENRGKREWHNKRRVWMNRIVATVKKAQDF